MHGIYGHLVIFVGEWIKKLQWNDGKYGVSRLIVLWVVNIITGSLSIANVCKCYYI